MVLGKKKVQEQAGGSCFFLYHRSTEEAKHSWDLPAGVLRSAMHFSNESGHLLLLTYYKKH